MHPGYTFVHRGSEWLWLSDQDHSAHHFNGSSLQVPLRLSGSKKMHSYLREQGHYTVTSLQALPSTLNASQHRKMKCKRNDPKTAQPGHVMPLQPAPLSEPHPPLCCSLAAQLPHLLGLQDSCSCCLPPPTAAWAAQL